MRQLAGVLATLGIFLCAACGDDPSPIAPSPSVTVTALNVAGGGTAGASFQLTAMAQLSDGKSQDVTGMAAWSSSNPQIASVAGGLVTVSGSGEVDVRATYQNVSGGIHLVVTPLPVTSLTISGATSDDRFQLTATARLSDGTTQNVTSLAAWESSNPLVATVSSTGFVTVVSSGETDVRASYRGISTSQRLTVAAPAGFALTGTVQEVAPTVRPIAGAAVRILGSGLAPTTTGANGSFSFAGVAAGRILIEVSQAGYVVAEKDLTITRDTQVAIDLFPTPPQDSSGATATARCNDGSWSWAGTKPAACTGNGGVAYTVCPGTLCGL